MSSLNNFLAKIKVYLILFFGLFIGSLFFSYGVYVGVYQIFPYNYLLSLKQTVVNSNHGFIEVSRESVRNDQFKLLKHKSNIVFVGDSITEQAIFNELLSNYKVANRGIGGDSVSDIFLRINSITSLDPKVVFIMAGINDIYKEKPINVIFEDYKKLVNALIERNIKIVIQSTIQCELLKCGKKKVESVNKLNYMLSDLSKQSGISFLNLKKLSEKNGLEKKFTWDGVHLTANAYIYWSSIILEELDDLDIS